jgi:hypothetical protein
MNPTKQQSIGSGATQWEVLGGKVLETGWEARAREEAAHEPQQEGVAGVAGV